MQTQIHQMSKKNKVTVPFYSPPFRLHGQTSADIIKEAREAVMTPSPVCIKPVHTNRPFTPNEKERTLFGKIRKNSRPPSSFSLRHLKNQEPTSRVKLPSIEIISRRKNHSTLHFSKNLSLDNLTEDYDAEAIEEIKCLHQEKFPTWKKAHSCPKEGRLSRVASLNDLSHSFDDKSYSRLIHVEHSDSLGTGNAKGHHMLVDSNSSGTSGDHISSESDETPTFPQNPVMAEGGGDFEVSATARKGSSGIDDQEAKEEPCSDDLTSENKENENILPKSEPELGELEEKKFEKAVVSLESTEKSTHSKESATEDFKKESKSEKELMGKPVTVAEKSVVTESKSEYLMSLKAGFKNKEVVKHPEPMPLEIQELYETARYYGVDVDGKDSENSPLLKSDESHLQESSLEKKSTDDCTQRENMKTLKRPQERQEAIKNGVTKESHVESSDNVEFVMNNKKRYHTVPDKSGVQEKAYKIWNHKQEANNGTPTPEPQPLNTWDIFWKNSYFKEKNEKEEANEKGSAESLQQLLNKIAELVKKGANDRLIYEATSQLYSLIKNDKTILDSKAKKNILRCLYLCVDIENPEILLSIAKLFFYLKEESSLSVACKIVFKVARFDTNDHLFIQEADILELFLEGIGRASPLDCSESCIYSYGALKFLTLNHNILSRILHFGGLDLMALHLKMINNAYAENGSVGEQTQHALFQLTGALRHVAAGEGALPLFLTTNSITILCNTLRYFSKDEDVVINISRTLSLLSTDEIVTQALMQVENILSTLIDLMERYKENDKILIRLAFCLGNIVEHSDLARIQLSRNDVALTVILNVLKLYIDKDLEISLKEDNCQSPDEPDSEVVDDVIVKVIRIIANMSMNPIVGSNLSPATKEKKSIQLSHLLSVLLMRKDPGITLLATLGCLNNISYYCNAHSVLVDITQGVERVLGLESVECQTEAARVLGNLTRHREIRDLIYSTGGVDLLIKLLSSPDQEVVRCACGALLNMLLDSETRKRFVEAQGIDKLVKTLEVFPDEWSLASLVARAIWNSCGDDVSSAMLHNNVENLLNFLASSLEEDNWNDGDVAWEEFASVATDLLEKISLHLEST